MASGSYIAPRIARIVAWPTTRHGALIASTMLWAFCALLLRHAGLSEFLEHRMVRPLEFRTRAALGAEPKINPALKVLALDDSTAAMLGGVRLETTDWLTLLPAIAAARPRAVLIDGMFSMRQDEAAGREAEVRGLLDLPTRIAVGSMVTEREVKYRSPLPVSRFAGAWSSETSSRSMSGTVFGEQDANAYGPTPLFQTAFHDIGHIIQRWPARFAPAMRLTHDVAAPHLALFAARERRLTATGIEANGAAIPVDDRGLAPIPFLSPAAITPRIVSLKSVLLKARAGERLPIDPDDVVVIITNFSTGNTDALDTPYGRIPGGYIIFTLVNSVMTGSWITEPVAEMPAVVAFTLVGTLLGYFSTSSLFWVNLLVLGGGYLGSALAAFSFASVALPWCLPLAALGGSATSAYALQRYRETRRRLQLEMEVATASALQQTFFPPTSSSESRFELAAYYHPAEAVGGDWYSYTVHAGRWLHLDLGDVTGHGTSPALLASFAKGAVDMIYESHRRRGLGQVPLADVHLGLNSVLGCGAESKSLMTLLSMAIDLQTGLCLYLNSGHRPAIVMGPDRPTRSITTRDVSTILGYQPLPGDMQPRSFQLRGDEIILIKSDGLIDVPQDRGVKVGEKSLQRLMMAHRHLAADGIRDTLARELLLDEKGPAFSDDVTFMVVRLRFEATGSASAA